jgi:hypothetical protein
MKIFDGDNVRDMTDEEIATNELIKKNAVDAATAQAQAAADKATAKQNVLAKLGLTADEVAALLS